jgi:hypothetical protein
VTDDRAADDNDPVPVSVRLGNVVPPEDPEDWTRPLTWVAAAGMLAAPLVTLAWFWAAAPTTATTPVPGTFAVAVVLAAGAAAAGSTQIGSARALAATLAATLFAALLVVAVGVAVAGERQLGAASPTLAHALAASLAGLAGALPGSAVNAFVAGWRSRLGRTGAAAAISGAVAVAVLPRLFAA